MAHTISLIHGDGIGKEVIGATRKIIDKSGVNISWEECTAGAEAFKKGLATGIPQETLDSITRTKIVLKGPLETPIGYGEKSANVTLRKCFETFANTRPVKNFPNVPTPYSHIPIDFVLVRENVEDLYAGIEYMPAGNVAEGLKLITQEGCEKVSRFAFELALAEGRSTVHCATKANILKFTEGMMKRVFEDVAKDYPQIEAHHIIVDNCAHQLVRTPEKFDVLVMTNMNGDILSDLASGLVGGLGFAPGANIGADIAIFEAVHGSAPKYAGKDVINPTAVLLSGTLMLRHIGEIAAANMIENALYVTMEEGFLTQDIAKNNTAVGTLAFTDRIIHNLGKKSPHWNARNYSQIAMHKTTPTLSLAPSGKCVGIDVFIEGTYTPENLGDALSTMSEDLPMSLSMIANRGICVYPDAGMRPAMSPSWQCRFRFDDAPDDSAIHALLSRIGDAHRWSTLKKLFADTREDCSTHDFFTRAQGER